MEAIILGNPYDITLGNTTPVVVPAYSSEESVIMLSDGYNPYIIGGTTTTVGDQYWFRYGSGLLRPLTITDKVIIGGSSILNTEIFRVVGKGNLGSIQLGTSTTINSILDEDNLISNSNTALPTQQSVKSYVDSQVLSAGIHIGDNISLLVNNVGYLITETDPIFTSSIAYGITYNNIVQWNEAYSWGNHATFGYLITETDPIFISSIAYSITSTNLTNWNDAYSKEHVHNNLPLLQTIINSGDGNSALFNDGNYKLTGIVAGTTNQIQYNISGLLSASSNLTFDPNSNILSSSNLLGTSNIYIGNSSTYLSKNVGNDLVFADANSGSISLATIIGGATNHWTTISGGIYYTNFVGINNPISLTDALTVNGNISATNFNSSYFNYSNSNLLLGPNAGALETGSNLLYIANTNTTTPLIYGDFLGQQLIFNADTYINSVKRLCFGDSTVSIRRDSSNNLVFQDPNANSGTAITLTQLSTLTGYALKSDFIAYSSVTTITAANLVTWGKASHILTSGSGSKYLGDDGNYYTASSGGITPTDNFVKWDTGSSYYRYYSSKTEAGGSSSGGKFYLGSTLPTNTNTLNYDGNLYAYQFSVNETSGTGFFALVTSGYGAQLSAITGIGVSAYSASGYAAYLQSTTGISLVINNITGNTSDLAQFQINSVNQAIINSSGINLITGATYKVNGVNILSTKQDTLVSGTNIKTINSTSLVGSGNILVEPVLGNPSADGYILSSTMSGTRSWVSSFPTILSDIFNWSTNKYTPYSIQGDGHFDNSSTNPVHTTRLNYDGNLYSNKFLASDSIVVSSSILTGILDSAGFLLLDSAGYTILDSTQSSVSTSVSTLSGISLDISINSTSRTFYNPGVSDGASAVAYTEDTYNLLSTSGSKLRSVLNQGVEKFSIDKDGNVNIPTGAHYKINGTNIGGGVTPIAGILDWDGTAYNPYVSQHSGISIDTSNTDPDVNSRLNINADLYATDITAIGNVSGVVGVFSNDGGGNVLVLGRTATTSTAQPMVLLSRDSSGTSYDSGHLISIIDNPTTSGTLTGSIFNTIVSSVVRIDMNPRVVNGSSAVAYIEDTHNLLSTAGAKIKSWRNQGTEKSNIDYKGTNNSIHFGGLSSTPTIVAGTGAGTSPTIAIVGTDAGFRVTLTTGTLPTSGGDICTVTFNVPYTSIPYAIHAAKNINSAITNSLVINTTTTTTLKLTNVTTALTAVTQYIWDILIIQ